MTLKELVSNFNTTPFLFIGSGFSRRYYNLPDWKGLLKVFINRLNSDQFAYNLYESKAKKKYPGISESELLPAIASVVEEEFNSKWFEDSSFRMLEKQYLNFVAEEHSPFKVEVCQYIANHSNIVENIKAELELFKKISAKSLSGIITTNYDTLLDNNTDGYTTYIGQDELVLSAIQGWAEIYKIHGSITNPKSIIITKEDYENFDKNCAYLAAKLMTIFMEYPIIFMGYSISDHNIQTILKEIVSCLSDEKLAKLQNRLVYVDWNKDIKSPEVSPSFITIGNKTINMTTVKTSNFSPIFEAISEKRSQLPAKLIRLFKQEFYTYALTNQPTCNLRVADINDGRVDGDELILAIGKPSTLGLRGLRGLTVEELYRHFVLHDLEFTADEILEYAYPVLKKQNNILPIFMLAQETKKDCTQYIKVKNYDDLLYATIRKTREKRKITHRSVNGIIKDNSNNPNNALYIIPYLYENEIDVSQLETFLKEKFSDSNYYNSLNDGQKSNLKRLVRIYDYLKYGRK